MKVKLLIRVLCIMRIEEVWKRNATVGPVEESEKKMVSTEIRGRERIN